MNSVILGFVLTLLVLQGKTDDDGDNESARRYGPSVISLVPSTSTFTWRNQTSILAGIDATQTCESRVIVLCISLLFRPQEQFGVILCRLCHKVPR